MKIFLKVIFGVFLIFLGLQLYSCSSQAAYNRVIISKGSAAYKNNDFTTFKEIFEYHKEEPLIEKSFFLEDANTLYGVTNRDISFDLTVYLQADKKSTRFTVILKNLEIETLNDVIEYSLRTVIKKDGGKEVLDKEAASLNRIVAKENWYIQYFEFDSDTIDQIMIVYPGPSSVEPIILYDSLKEEEFKEGFLNKESDDLVKQIKEGLLEENGIVQRKTNPFTGKATSVIVTMVMYVAVSAVLIYALFFNKGKKAQTYPEKQSKKNIKK